LATKIQKGNSILIDTKFSQPIIATNEIIIRRAILAHAEQISALVDLGVSEGQLLPRSPEMIAASIDDWVVAEDSERVIGIGSLLEMSSVLLEVRSLVVAPEYRKFGIGTKIVDGLVEEARARGVPTVFALTRAVAFFERRGFIVTDKENFPEKVWRDCIVCPVRFNCDEIAVVKQVNR
jgi:amino-acid N-acetyltransferase